MQMRKACRTAWNRDDANKAAETLERLVRSIYGRASDHNQPDYCFLRFQIAERLEKGGKFNSNSDLAEINCLIEEDRCDGLGGESHSDQQLRGNGDIRQVPGTRGDVPERVSAPPLSDNVGYITAQTEK